MKNAQSRQGGGDGPASQVPKGGSGPKLPSAGNRGKAADHALRLAVARVYRRSGKIEIHAPPMGTGI